MASDPQVCPECNGAGGKFRWYDGRWFKCWKCYGTGTVESEDTHDR